MRSYSYPLCYYIEALKKAGGEYEGLSKEEAEGYLSTLKDTCEYRIEVRRTALCCVNPNRSAYCDLLFPLSDWESYEGVEVLSILFSCV